MVVMVLIGIVAGVGMSGFDRIEPGRSSMQAAVENFIESSRDRARASNQNVVVSLRPETEQEPARWQNGKGDTRNRVLRVTPVEHTNSTHPYPRWKHIIRIHNTNT